jgi:hypothetical protein
MKMELFYLLIGLIVIAGGALYFLIERKGRKILEELKADQSSPMMWTMMQQQMEQLRGQMSDGLNKNISLLTEQL